MSLFVVLFALSAIGAVGFQPPPGVIITGASIVDGTGAPTRSGSVRIEGSVIVAVGDLKPRDADRVVDARGLVLAPGFIDIHNHSTSGLAQDRAAAATQVAQGITTVVVGADGSSPWPIADYTAERRANPAAVHVMMMVGHGTVRLQVMGDDYKRAARADEITAGKAADLVLFDPARVADRATFQAPAVLPTGIEKVWVAGRLVWDAGKPTGATPGVVLK